MGSMIGSAARESEEREARAAAAAPCESLTPAAAGRSELSVFYCSVCLEVLCNPVRTRCRHVFCRSCLAASVQSNTYACPYCRAHLSAEGVPAYDIIKKMKTVLQECDECKEMVCLSNMRDHLNRCEAYLNKYGPLQELGKCVPNEYCYACPYCQPIVELNEDGLVQHCLNDHSAERTPVVCPVCHLVPGGDPSYMRTLAMHLHARHTYSYDDYIDISIVEDALIESILDISFFHFVTQTNTDTDLSNQ